MKNIKEERVKRKVTGVDLGEGRIIKKKNVSMVENKKEVILSKDKASKLSSFFEMPIYHFVDLESIFPYELTDQDIDIIIEFLESKKKYPPDFR